MSAKVYQAEAIELLRSLDRESVACICTDPPYSAGGFTEANRRAGSETGQSRTQIHSDNVTTGGLLELLRLVSVEAARVLRPDGWLLVFCDWRMSAMLAPRIESGGLRWQSMIVWDKVAAGLGRGFRAQHELVLAFTRGTPAVHNASPGNVISAPRTGNLFHPTEKPTSLIGELLSVTTTAGDLVVDPFMGSGSVGVAAAGMGRDFIGCDTDPRWLQVAADRIGEVCSVEAPQAAPPAQPSMFASLGLAR